MSRTAKKKSPLVLSASCDIRFDQLVLSQSNVRKTQSGVSIENLAEDIVRRGLLQGLSVRAVTDETGADTGMYEVPAGGRRFRALELLVKQKRLSPDTPIPCILREGGIAEEDSLAENTQRQSLHPLDQFRAFLTLREKGQSEEDIAAAFFVTTNVVKQRLKLAAVSPALLDVYAQDGMTLEQLMAYTVTGDHARQEEIHERLKSSYDKSPYTIRRLLTEGAVRASDKRAQFVGIDAYIEAGGLVLRDLFESDDGGWLQDAAMLDRLVHEKLKVCAEPIAGEGWKWVEMAVDFPYGHTHGLRKLRGETLPLTDDEQSTRVALQAEYDKLIAEYQDSAEDLPDIVDTRFAELETAIARFDDRPTQYDPDDIGRAGVFISLTSDGRLRIDGAYVRPEDEPAVDVKDRDSVDGEAISPVQVDTNAPSVESEEDDDDDDGLAPISDRLLTELTAHRTLGLREALGRNPDIAMLAALHALVLKTFYHSAHQTCLELDMRINNFGAAGSGLDDTQAADAIRARHETWAKSLPSDPADLWDSLGEWDADSRGELFAHIVSLSINAVHESWNRRPGALAHADRLAQAVELDMSAIWTPSVANYLGRVTKGRILKTVAEARGQRAADRIAHLKKAEMAIEAQALLADSAWLPETLRKPGMAEPQPVSDVKESEAAGAEEGEVDPMDDKEEALGAGNFLPQENADESAVAAE